MVRTGLIVAALIAALALTGMVAVSGQRHPAALAVAHHAAAHVVAPHPVHPRRQQRAAHRRHTPKPHAAAPAPPQNPPYNPSVPSATIVIPRLGVRAPVYDRGVDGSGHLPIASGYAVTHFRYSASLGQRGNYVIYGHDDIEGNIFRYLGSLQAGDRVYVHRGPHEYVYQVTGSTIVLPTQVSVLDPTPSSTLTMISCTPYWVDSHRIVVRAGLIGAR